MAKREKDPTMKKISVTQVWGVPEKLPVQRGIIIIKTVRHVLKKKVYIIRPFQLQRVTVSYQIINR